MAIADAFKIPDDGGRSGGYSNLPTNEILLSPYSFGSKEAACTFIPINGYSKKLAYQDAKALNLGNTIYEFSLSYKLPFNGGNKWWALAHTAGAILTGASRALQIDTSGRIIGVYNCDTDSDDDGGDIIIPDPTPPVPPSIPSPTSDLIYSYFVLENLSRSKKIFAYYSGSQNFNYTFSTTTSSADPGAGFFRLNSGSEGSDGTTNENQSTEMYIDIKDNQGEEDIITYLTSLSSSLSATGTPATPYGEVQLFISGSGADQYYHRFDLQNVTFEGPDPAVDGYFKLDIVTKGSSPGSNPLSSSIAAGSGSNVEVRFFNDIIPGYHETEVTSLDKDYVIACVTQTASYGSGSISQPFAISWGMPESEFLNPDFYPTQPGYAWLWNDGYKVKHIKINNESFGGDKLTDFIKHSYWSRFVLYNPFNAQGNLLHSANGNYPETFYLHNVTKFKPYTHLFVDQENRDTTFAVDSQNFASTNHNFLAEGKYIVDAKASGTVVEPIITTNISESLPQGYFPSASSNYPTEQFFRGWVDANYYSNGTLVGTGGNYSDPLRQFETGSTERDYDAAPAYLRSTIPFFINATSSYIPISSSDFGTYSSQPNTIRVGPGLRTTGGDVLAYYYEETTGKILISGAEHLDTKKTENYIFNNLYDTELVAPSNETTTYITPDLSYIIEVKPSQSLWLSRGRDAANAGDTDRYKYNRYLHRPYKAYVLLGTGSTDAGYGGDEFGDGVYGEGTVPVGPPVNEAVQIFMHYSQSSANLRSDGIYTFDTLLSEDVGLTASVDLSYRSDTYVPPTVYGESEYGDGDSEYGGEGSGTDILTWRTASLNIYKNSSILATETVYIEPTDIESGRTITVKYPLTQNEIATGDTLRLALEVDTTDTQPFNAALIATSYTMSIEGTVPPTDDKVPVTFNNYLELNDDCDPLVANIVGDRPNARLQDVDYSSPISGSLYPVNFEQIIRDEAVRSTVPESNYTKLASMNPRYVGSSTTRQNVNEYNSNNPIDNQNAFLYTNDEVSTIGKGPNLGKIPNVELKNSYIAYFNKIIDPYPNLNHKTAYYVKYLIDENGTIFEPTLSDINYSIFDKTFQLSDYDSKPTRVKTSLQNIEEAKELSKLNEGVSSTFKLGEYPTPVLYTQNSATTAASNIVLSGSKFYSTLGVGVGFSDFSYQAFATSSVPFVTNNDVSTNLPNTRLSYEGVGEDIIINSDGTGSYSGNGIFTFPLDANSEEPDTQGGVLSDNLELNGNFKFYTTSVPPAYEFGSYANENKDCCGRKFMEFNFNVYQNTYGSFKKTTTDFKFLGLTLNILQYAETTSPTTLSIDIPLGSQSSKSETTSGLTKTSQGINLKLNSQWLWAKICQAAGKPFNNSGRDQTRALIGGGWGGDGYKLIQVQWEWDLRFSLGSSNNYFKQGSGYYFEANGTMIANKECRRKSRDFFTNFAGSGYSKNNGFRWKRSFHPNITGTDVRKQPSLQLQLTGPISDDATQQNGASAPFWKRVPGTNNQLYMASPILNQAYGNIGENGESDKYFVQIALPYSSSTNVDFPFTREPDFINFDPITDIWSLKEGDEIRFQNDEDLVYTISSVNGTGSITPPILPNETNDYRKNLTVTVTPSFDETQPSDFDFFLIRRYKENKNFIILDQQKPYGITTDLSGSIYVTPSSSPGILLPEHRTEVYNRNPDEVLKDLIEKRII